MTLIPYSPIVTGHFLRGLVDADSIIRANVKEDKDAYVVEAELPGVRKEDVTLICEKGVLTISAKVEAPKEDEGSRYVRRERPEGTLVRRFALENIDEASISAKMEDGILSITLPKRTPDERRIEIQ